MAMKASKLLLYNPFIAAFCVVAHCFVAVEIFIFMCYANLIIKSYPLCECVAVQTCQTLIGRSSGKNR